jgi:hypothetical protein
MNTDLCVAKITHSTNGVTTTAFAHAKQRNWITTSNNTQKLTNLN